LAHTPKFPPKTLNRGSHPRVFGLDILRAVAILSVVYEHGIYLLGGRVNPHLYMSVVFGDGVTMFFVLSGFLIGTILIDKSINHEFRIAELMEFWLRRWFRTLPAYYLVLGIIISLSVLIKNPLPSNIALYAIFSQNVITVHPPFFPEAWSLSVEEWFYFLVPLAVFIFIARLEHVSRRKALIAFLIGGISAVTAARIQTALTHDLPDIAAWDLLLRKRVIMRLDSIGFGILGAYCCAYYPKIWNAVRKPLLCFGLLVCLFEYLETNMWQHAFYRDFFELSVAPIGILLLLPFLTGIRSGRGPIYRFLTFISKISYSMYLLHYSLIQLIIIPALFANVHFYGIAYTEYALYGCLTISLSYLLFQYYELPMMNRRDKLKLYK
jgi:peptidoglycan/LPS O-acetylase OafA/YrhL